MKEISLYLQQLATCHSEGAIENVGLPQYENDTKINIFKLTSKEEESEESGGEESDSEESDSEMDSE